MMIIKEVRIVWTNENGEEEYGSVMSVGKEVDKKRMETITSDMNDLLHFLLYIEDECEDTVPI